MAGVGLGGGTPGIRWQGCCRSLAAAVAGGVVVVFLAVAVAVMVAVVVTVALTVVVAVAVAGGGSNHDNYTCSDNGGDEVNKRMFFSFSEVN